PRFPFTSVPIHLTFLCFLIHRPCTFYLFFFYNNPATSEIYILSLHDALPISSGFRIRRCRLVRTSASFPCQTCRSERKPRNRRLDRKSTRLNSSHVAISYAVFCLKKKKKKKTKHINHHKNQ